MARRKRVGERDMRQRAAVAIERSENENRDDVVAHVLTRPEVQAAAVIQRFEAENHDVNALVRELTLQVEAVRRGDMGRPEAMLIAQAHTLDGLFANLARRSCANMTAGHASAAEIYLRLALKAQAQCRATLETLAELKNPRPVAFVKQANIANGPQQVNNGTAPVPPARAGESSIQSNELSSESYELRPDTGASAPACRIDTQVETLAEINRAAD